MIVLGLDFETSGLNPEKNQIIEVGAALWDSTENTYLSLQSYLVAYREINWDPGMQEWHAKDNGITVDRLLKYGVAPPYAIKMLNAMIAKCEFICAHNGIDFDHAFYYQACKSVNESFIDRVWIDTKTDLELKGCNRLSHLAADLGFINPFPHRALFDVVTMLKILSHYDINHVIEIAQSPRIQIEAIVSYDTRQLAKDRYFRWDLPGFSRRWTKQIRQIHLDDEKIACKEHGFEIRVLS